jgi:hypothetical protein
MNINSLGPILAGAVIGWTVYYFMRQFALFSPASLTATIAAFAGGPLLKHFNPDAPGIQSHYFFGLGLGFFAYALYLGILLLLVGAGSFDEEDFEFFARKGFPTRQEREFVRLMQGVKEHSNGQLDKKTLHKRVRQARPRLSQKAYKEIADEVGMERGRKLIQEFEQMGLDKELVENRNWFFHSLV